jgi:hypothetical protein
MDTLPTIYNELSIIVKEHDNIIKTINYIIDNYNNNTVIKQLNDEYPYLNKIIRYILNLIVVSQNQEELIPIIKKNLIANINNMFYKSELTKLIGGEVGVVVAQPQQVPPHVLLQRDEKFIMDRKADRRFILISPSSNTAIMEITDEKERKEYVELILRKTNTLLSNKIDKKKNCNLFVPEIMKYRLIKGFVTEKGWNMCDYADCLYLKNHLIGDKMCIFHHLQNVEFKDICRKSNCYCDSADGSLIKKPIHINWHVVNSFICTTNKIPNIGQHILANHYIVELLNQTITSIDYTHVQKIDEYTLVYIDNKFVGYI